MENKTILMFSPIYSFTAESIVEKILSVDKNEDIEIWVNSPGGSVFAGWSIIGVLNERTGKITMKVLGDASSMAFYMLLFADKVESLDVSNFIIHRADGRVESDEDQEFLNGVNAQLREKLQKRIDSETFQKVTGKTFDEVFDTEKRIDVVLTAKQAKKIGLVDKIVRLEPKQIAALNKKIDGFIDFSDNEVVTEDNTKVSANTETENDNINIQKEIEMTKEEIQAFGNDILQKERDRVNAFLAFIEIDSKAVIEKIKAGDELSQTFMAEMTAKAISAQTLKKVEDESVEDVTVDAKVETEKVTTDSEAEIKAVEAEMFRAAGLKVKEV